MTAAGGEHGSIGAAVAALWEEARPRMLERVGMLEDAVAALMGGELDEDGRDHARREAHKLAGAVGPIVFPYFLLIGPLAPVVELVGIVAVVLGLLFGAVNVPFAILFLLVAYGFGVLLTAWTLVLEQWTYRGYGRLLDRLWLLLVSLVEGLGYRQLTAVWRLRGLIGYLRGRREWGVMTRQGFAEKEQAPV